MAPPTRLKPVIIYNYYIDKIRCEAYTETVISINMDLRCKMMRAHTEDAKVFKAFCDENRLQILEMLRSGEKCACKLLENLNIGQSTLSHHMKILCDSGIVRGRSEGKWTHYSICEEGCGYAKELLASLTAVNTAHTPYSCSCVK